MRFLPLLPILLAATHVHAATPSITPEAVQSALVGDWVMHIYLLDKNDQPKLFEDQVHLQANKKGALTGTLTVPGLFTAAIAGVKIASEGAFSFEIEASEGHGKFRVRYDGRMNEDLKTFVGFGNVTAPEQELLGGFVGQKLKRPFKDPK